MPVPPTVLELIERFDRNHAAYKSDKYNEARLRIEFLNPFFEALGWDINNRQGYAEAYKDVIYEDAIKIGGATKAPDYCFRIGGTRKFFVEAKKPVVNLRDAGEPAFQLRRYAWSAKLPLSILTDFEEFAIYDCRIKPDQTDRATTARVMYFPYTEYATRWEEITNIFSRDAILKGSFDTYAEATKGKRGTAEVDTAFLQEIETWRDILAHQIALRNRTLTQRELNFAVQMTIDRIIFLRICEDRGIEEYERLKALLKGTNVYTRLMDLFEEADERYNSGLFHFHKEKDFPGSPDTLTPNLVIDDKPIKDIVKRLYYPDSPYEFSALPASVLGQVYEQFLGKVIQLSPAHQVKIEEKLEVRKAGGVYYTPDYIVDYIVRQTLGKLLEGKKPGARGSASKIKIVDPSCGSGSFLLVAYQYLLDWHRDRYVEIGPEKHRKELYQGAGGQWLLATQEKKRILLNSIYGVDIDSQAVEVTKLSLLLKVLEGESNQSLVSQLSLFKERALPDLERNIKCGNSLIDTSFYDVYQPSLLDEEERYHINVFDWQEEFSEVMEQGGFNIVIGNPPWGASFTEPELAYLRDRYRRVINRMVDSYIYFIDKAMQLVNTSGIIGYIIPSTLLNQVDATAIRRLLLERGLTTLINLGQNIFTTKVFNTSTIVIAARQEAEDTITLDNFSSLLLYERKTALETAKVTTWNEWKEVVQHDPHLTFFTGNEKANVLLDRLRQKHISLGRVIEGEIQRGVSPDVVKAHVVSSSEAKAAMLEEELLKPSVSGGQIKRYDQWTIDQYIIYTTRATPIAKFPNVARYLNGFKHQNKCKEVIQGKHPSWALHRPRDRQIFASPKFIGLTTSKTIQLIYDVDASVYVTDAMYVFRLLPEYNPFSFMAILQSKMFHFLYHTANQGESRVIPQVKASKLVSLPYPMYKDSQPNMQKLSQLSINMVMLHKQMHGTKMAHDKTALQRQIAKADQQIDKLVYELYGLTEEEMTIIEEEFQGK